MSDIVVSATRQLQLRAADILAGRALRFQELVAGGAPELLLDQEERLIAKAIAIWTMACCGLTPSDELESEFMQDALASSAGSGGDEPGSPLPFGPRPVTRSVSLPVQPMPPVVFATARDALLRGRGSVRSDHRPEGLRAVIDVVVTPVELETLRDAWAQGLGAEEGAPDVS